MKYAILAALAAALLGFSMMTPTSVSAEAWQTRCGDRAAADLVKQIQFMFPDDFAERSGVERGEWFTAQNRVITQFYFQTTASNVYQQENDVCNRGERDIAIGLALIVEDYIEGLGPFYTHSPYQCASGFNVYNNYGGIYGNAGGFFSVWSDGTAWDSPCYVNPIELIEADLGIGIEEIWNQTYGSYDPWGPDHDQVLLKRYYDPSVEPCSVAATVYDACRYLAPFGLP